MSGALSLESGPNNNVLQECDIKTELDSGDEYGGPSQPSEEEYGGQNQPSSTEDLQSYIFQELPSLLPGVLSGNGTMADMAQLAWHQCTRCNKVMKVPTSQVVSSRHPACQTSTGYNCPVCLKDVVSAMDFDLHLEYHCWMKNGQSLSCDGCGKDYLLFKEPVVKEEPEWEINQCNGTEDNTEDNSEVDEEEEEDEEENEEGDDEDVDPSFEVEEKKPRGRPRKSDSTPKKKRGRPAKPKVQTVQEKRAKRASPKAKQQSSSRKSSRKVSRAKSKKKKQMESTSEDDDEESESVSKALVQLTQSSTGLTCNICQRSFTRMRSLNIHMMLHTGERPSQCDKCDSAFRTNSELRRHTATKHMDVETAAVKALEEFPCMVCNKSYASKDSLRRHMVMHTNPKSFSCQTCGKTFTRSSDVKKHELSHKSPGQECPICGKVVSRKDALKIHMRIHTGERPFQCRHCDERFYCHSHRSSHERFRHLGEKRDYRKRNEPLNLSCEVCGKHFSRRASLKDHMFLHTGVKPYACEICGKTFIRKTHLNDHQKYHDEPNLQCNECGKMFRKKISLTAHLRIHSGDLPFQCDECGKKFHAERSLTKHMLSHNVVPKRCPLCNKSYKDLPRHLKIHSSQKTFKCRKCSIIYYNPLDLKLHRYAEHLNKKWPYTCQVCDKSLSNQRSLDRHSQAVHSRGKPFICNLCPERFNSKSRLQIHERIHGKKKLQASENEKYRCVECGNRCTTSTRLVLHRKIHQRYRPHKCPTCKRSFITKSLIEQHTCRSKKLSKIICYLCGATFPNKYQLKSHTRTMHHVSSPHKCFLCPQRFGTLKEYIVHCRGHTGYKPYPCTLCDRAYKTEPEYHSHQIIVHLSSIVEHAEDEEIDELDFPDLPLLSVSMLAAPNLPPVAATPQVTEPPRPQHQQITEPLRPQLQQITEPPRPQHQETVQTKLPQTLPQPTLQPTTSNIVPETSNNRPVQPPPNPNYQATPKPPPPISAAPIQHDPSAMMLQFLQNQVRSYVSGTDQSGASGVQRDHILLSLTILKNFLVSGSRVILDLIEENNIVDLLLSLLSVRDAYLRRMSSQVVALWIRTCHTDAPLQCVQTILAGMTPDSQDPRHMTPDSRDPRHALTAKLEVLMAVFSKADVSSVPTNTDRELSMYKLVLSHAQTLLTLFLSPGDNTTQHNNTQTDSVAATHCVLSLWDALLAYFMGCRLQLLSQTPSVYQEADQVDAVTTQLLYALEAGLVAPSCVCRAIAAVSRCLPYGELLSLNVKYVAGFHTRLACKVLTAYSSGRLLTSLPLVSGPESFGAAAYVRDRGRPPPEGSSVSGRALRAAVLLGVKSVAVIMAAITQGLQFPVSPIQSLLSIQGQAVALCPADTDVNSPAGHTAWVFCLCREQDDVLVELLLCLLDINLVARNVSHILPPDSLQWLGSQYDPHQYFLGLLARRASWSPTVINRWIASKSSCFTHYFTRYLEYLLMNWPHFVSICREMSQTMPSGGVVQHGGIWILDSVISLFSKLRGSVNNADVSRLLGMVDNAYRQ